eukprot:TRINITY_DN4962_c0_g1_i3.p1 TRINITY_DN4962_c0_g1~~TRINITY_DN4962_c0_g1_i3.p1  ORF type:complete len:685 (-),score=86.44 TRINITY_DN4962_c0_g1_i3:407-2461(-)
MISSPSNRLFPNRSYVVSDAQTPRANPALSSNASYISHASYSSQFSSHTTHSLQPPSSVPYVGIVRPSSSYYQSPYGPQSATVASPLASARYVPSSVTDSFASSSYFSPTKPQQGPPVNTTEVALNHSPHEKLQESQQKSPLTRQTSYMTPRSPAPNYGHLTTRNMDAYSDSASLLTARGAPQQPYHSPTQLSTNPVPLTNHMYPQQINHVSPVFNRYSSFIGHSPIQNVAPSYDFQQQQQQQQQQQLQQQQQQQEVTKNEVVSVQSEKATQQINHQIRDQNVRPVANTSSFQEVATPRHSTRDNPLTISNNPDQAKTNIAEVSQSTNPMIKAEYAAQNRPNKNNPPVWELLAMKGAARVKQPLHLVGSILANGCQVEWMIKTTDGRTLSKIHGLSGTTYVPSEHDVGLVICAEVRSGATIEKAHSEPISSGYVSNYFRLPNVSASCRLINLEVQGGTTENRQLVLVPTFSLALSPSAVPATIQWYRSVDRHNTDEEDAHYYPIPGACSYIFTPTCDDTDCFVKVVYRLSLTSETFTIFVPKRRLLLDPVIEDAVKTIVASEKHQAHVQYQDGPTLYRCQLYLNGEGLKIADNSRVFAKCKWKQGVEFLCHHGEPQRLYISVDNSQVHAVTCSSVAEREVILLAGRGIIKSKQMKITASRAKSPKNERIFSTGRGTFRRFLDQF